MKKFLLIVTLLGIGSIIDAKRMGVGRPAPVDPQEDFKMMMNEDWDTMSNPKQAALDRSWQSWTINQKKDVLLRLYEQGLLTEEDVTYWQTPREYEIPIARYVEMGG